MCPFDSIVSSGVEVDKVVFYQFWNVLRLFSSVMLSIRSFFTMFGSTSHNFPRFLPSK